ncbi:hypothetical protein MC378_10265 [Polaribacter sp. MSW13]|uniref:Uncharacterized protein n=1 Tax=Polaribacter marinus TaxID=2916838 RepID=A0A9X1VNU2_9FLAO|nr:hypothetical protein [Polaribacter marinus]MCI2229551.1 hypothetical protein [Polaribacter marinus]
MEGILKQLKKQREKLVKAAEHRDKYYSNRSEAWKDSATGVIYNEKTGEIADVVASLDITITELDNLLNDC